MWVSRSRACRISSTTLLRTNNRQPKCCRKATTIRASWEMQLSSTRSSSTRQTQGTTRQTLSMQTSLISTWEDTSAVTMVDHTNIKWATAPRMSLRLRTLFRPKRNRGSLSYISQYWIALSMGQAITNTHLTAEWRWCRTSSSWRHSTRVYSNRQVTSSKAHRTCITSRMATSSTISYRMVPTRRFKEECQRTALPS